MYNATRKSAKFKRINWNQKFNVVTLNLYLQKKRTNASPKKKKVTRCFLPPNVFIPKNAFEFWRERKKTFTKLFSVCDEILN